jgi:hypothetical protein
VLGPARISALFNDFMSAPFQDWSLALYFADQPVVDSVSPGSGSPEGGTAVSLSGHHYGSGARVFFGEEEATQVVVVDSNTITCITPMGGSGQVDVSVVMFTSLRGTLQRGFEYADPIPDIDLVDDGEIDELDLLAILAEIQDDQLLADILFVLSRFWEDVAP